MDDWRKRSRRPQLADDPDALGQVAEGVGGDVEDDALARVGAENVHRLCGELPEDQRTVLLLRILADLTIEQVAEVMDRSAGAVKALQRRGLRTLRTLLEEGSPERAGTGVPTAYPYPAVVR
jgi:RNA polymerase sigma-70 factor (ECF subfamily)